MTEKLGWCDRAILMLRQIDDFIDSDGSRAPGRIYSGGRDYVGGDDGDRFGGTCLRDYRISGQAEVQSGAGPDMAGCLSGGRIYLSVDHWTDSDLDRGWIVGGGHDWGVVEKFLGVEAARFGAPDFNERCLCGWSGDWICGGVEAEDLTV